jgi:flagellar basal-body rod protein FlgG
VVRGLYAATSGALVAQAAVDNIANNLANVNTAGFKRTLLQVQAQPDRALYRFQTDPGRAPGARLDGVAAMQYVGPLGSGAQILDTPTVFEQGAIAATGNDLDVALSGPGFFAIRDGNGTLTYTRDGQFLRDAQGYLTAQNGDRVLDRAGQPILLPPQGAIGIGKDGTITVDGQTQDQLAVVEFRNPTALRPQGSQRFVDTGAAAPAAAANTSVLQGSLEKSNADVVRSMVDLIANERWFDANIKVVQTEDSETGNAISNVGRTAAA